MRDACLPRSPERKGPCPARAARPSHRAPASAQHRALRRMPPSASIVRSAPTASTIAGNARAVDGTPSSWRPPWFDTTIPSAPCFAASLASSGSRIPLTISGPFHSDRIQSRSAQLTAGSKLSRIHAKKSLRPVCPFSTGAILPSWCGRPMMPTSHAQRGCIAPCQPRPQRPRKSRRPGQSRMIVAVPRPGHRHVDGEYEGAALRRPRLREQIAHEGAVADHVELEPERLCGANGNLGNRTGRNGRQREGNASIFRRARRLNFATPCVHPSKSYGRERNGQGELLAEQSGGQVDAGHIAQDALAQRDVTEIGICSVRVSPRHRIRRRCNRTGNAASAAGPARDSLGSTRRSRDCVRLPGKGMPAPAISRQVDVEWRNAIERGRRLQIRLKQPQRSEGHVVMRVRGEDCIIGAEAKQARV